MDVQKNKDVDLTREGCDVMQVARESDTMVTMDAISGEFQIPPIPCLSQEEQIRLMKGFPGAIASPDGLRRLKALLPPIKYINEGYDWSVLEDNIQTITYEEKEIPREKDHEGKSIYEECILDWDKYPEDFDFNENVGTLVASNDQMTSEEVEEVHQLDAKRMDYAVVASSPKFQCFFFQVGIPTHMRKDIVGAILDKISDIPGVSWEESMPTFIKQFMDRVTFSEADRVCRMLHNMPLYISIFLNNFNFRRTLLDGGASVDILPMSTFVSEGLNKEAIKSSNTVISGYNNQVSETLGHIALAFKIVSWSTHAKFHIINDKTSYHILLGRPWIHSNGIVPSTYHHCAKTCIERKERIIKGVQRPFAKQEVHFTEAALFTEVEEEEELAIVPYKSNIRIQNAMERKKGLNPGKVVIRPLKDPEEHSTERQCAESLFTNDEVAETSKERKAKRKMDLLLCNLLITWSNTVARIGSTGWVEIGPKGVTWVISGRKLGFIPEIGSE